MKKTFAVLAALLLLTGCFEIDSKINLQKDLSGTADFHLGVDLEPMVVVMAQFAKEMEGKSEPVTAADIAKAKADFKKSSTKGEKKGPPTVDRAELEKELPKGVKLLDFGVKEREFGVDSDMKFGFDKLQSLVGVKFPSKEGGDPTSKSIVDTPFEGLEVVEKGDTITIRAKANNPAEDVKEQASEGGPPMNAQMEKLMKDAFGKMRVSYRITAPFTVVSHNATRKEGNTLVWEFTMASFEKMAKDKAKADDFSPRVTYKR